MALLPAAARAQAGPIWPRNAAGRIEFRGQLAWPDTARTEVQRQLLVRRWYRRGLTSDGPAQLRRFIAEGTTYAGVPNASCYRLRVAGPDDEYYTLYFQMQLVAENTGLRYCLTEFEAGNGVYDAFSSFPLEEATNSTEARAQAVLTNFHQRLLTALKGW